MSVDVSETKSSSNSNPSEDVAFRVEMLPADEGDCLLVTVPLQGGGEFVILVDTGQGPLAREAVEKRLSQFPTDEDQMRRLNLFIVTHIDQDHIVHAKKLLEDTKLKLAFDDIWFNGFEETGEGPLRDGGFGTLSVNQADKLSEAIHKATPAMPHNIAFGHGPVQVPEIAGEPPTVLDTTKPSHASGSYTTFGRAGGPQITVLSPIPQDLRELGHGWDSDAHPKHRDPAVADVQRAKSTDERTPVPDSHAKIEEIAGRPFTPEESRENTCSIVVLLENKGRRLLLTGDGHPHVYEPALKVLREDRASSQRGSGADTEAQPFVIDAIKVAHHGSADNTSAALREYRAGSYLISTNGHEHEHPDTESLARLIVDAEVEPTFYFNYPSPRALEWEKAASELGGFSVERPPDDQVGMVFELHADGPGRSVSD